MINLIGCSKKILQLMKYMDYKKDKSTDTYIFSEKRKKEK